MTQIPGHSAKKAIKALKKLGFKQERQAGSHVVMTKDGIVRPLIIPIGHNHLAQHIIGQILRTGKISKKKYRDALKG